MKKIYTFGHSLEYRNLTVADKIANKQASVKMTQVTAQNEEEARIIADQGVDMIITGSDWYPEVRKGAPNTFITAALFAGRYITDDQILEGALNAAMAGADSVLTPRSMRVVEILANESLSFQGHVGLVPSVSTKYEGLRARGKTAAEALEILEDMRRLEDAGAYGCKVECVAEDALAEISKHTSLVTNSIGAGTGGDVIFLFFTDICGETDDPPRHAKAWGDGLSIRKQLDAERRKAVKGFHDDVKNGAFPEAKHSVQMHASEKDLLLEQLDKIPSKH
jgi:3-methyl-2-oxobutanoate hydroxymethyltransferase